MGTTTTHSRNGHASNGNHSHGSHHSVQSVRQLESLYDKPLPANVEAERYILGGIILNNDCINQAAEHLTSEDFYPLAHKKIYQTLLDLYEKGRDMSPITIQDTLQRKGDLESVGGPAYIAYLFEGVPIFSNIQGYVRIVKSKSILRRLITASNFIISISFDEEDEAEEILNKAEKEILSIADDKIKQGLIHISKIADKQLDAIEELASRGQLITGIASGFDDLDYMTAGFQRGDLIIIAARPSQGKTALATAITKNVAINLKSDHKPVVAFFSIEMSKEQLVQRFLCSQAHIDSHRFRSGMLKKEDWKRLAKSIGELSEAEIYLDDTPGLSVLELRAKCRRLKHEKKSLDLVVIDYLQLMSGHGRTESRQQEVSQISRELKILAKELDVPLVSLAQLSRAPENRADHRPILSDLRESGSIEMDADVVMFIYREEVYKPETVKQGIAEIILGKQRNGPIGSVELVFLKEFTQFENSV